MQEINKLINKVLWNDCLEAMQDIPDNSIDMILCDLPYGTTACSWDIVIDFDLLWTQYKRIVKDNACICLFGSQPFTTDLINSNREWFKYEWIWIKNLCTGFLTAKYMPMKSHENICIFYNNNPKYNPIKTKGAESTIKRFKNKNVVKRSKQGNTIHNLKKSMDHPIDSQNINPKSYINFNCVQNANSVKLHTTQKPVKLFEYLIKTYTDENDIVLDNCAGSGTTGVACKKLGRRFILIEKENKYIDIINKRLAETNESMSLLNTIEKQTAQMELF